MSFWRDIILGPVNDILDKIVPDADTRASLKHELLTLETKQDFQLSVAQIKTNQVEAAHKSLFVAGWRPGAGWICVMALANNFIITPYINLILKINQIYYIESGESVLVQLPILDLEVMLPILFGMLGLGVYRTKEKLSGVAREK